MIMEIKELRELPEKIKIKEEGLRETEIKKDAYLLQIEKVNISLLDSILNTKDENNKLKFSNEISRKNALAMSQINSNVYCTAKQNVNKSLEVIESLKIDLRFYHNQMRIEEIISRLSI